MKLPRGQCAVCSRTVAVRIATGTVREHPQYQGSRVVCSGSGRPPVEPNACPIAAASELLAVARSVVNYFGDEPLDPFLDADIALRDAARAAIAKAEGR